MASSKSSEKAKGKTAETKPASKALKSDTKETETAKPAAVKTHRSSAAKAKTTDKAPKSSQATVEKAKKTVPAAAATPSHQEIAQLAYSYWELRGHAHGQEHEDWLRAEVTLRGGKAMTAGV